MTTTALLIIDMQMDMQRRLDSGADVANPDTPARVAALIRAFRAAGQPVIHVHHAESDPGSPFHPSAPGQAVMPCAAPAPGEPVFVKSTSSAFASTGLAAHLREEGIGHLVVAGAVAAFCINSTVRAGADVGFRMTVAQDAVLGFGLLGARISAQTLLETTLAVLAADFAVLEETAVLTAG